MTLFPRILAFCAAFSLAFPTGWCCRGFVAGAAETGEEVPVEPHTCCHQTAPPQPTPDTEEDESPAPVPPACCCQPEPAVTAEPVKLPVAADLAILAGSVTLDAPLFGGAAPSTPLDTFAHSPPLQVLHCVWLC
ncbi:MAG: hypothetical protein L0Z62_07575 [Gemmataceae bacterium]|nr:hypothetical protein [Gemmataceae bacterium]